MLEIISQGFKQAQAKFSGLSSLTEGNIAEALKEVQSSLLDADVEYSVVKRFVAKVKEGCLGQQVQLRAGAGDSRVRVKPGDHFVKICHDELQKLMGSVETELKMATNRPTTVMMVGLQGSGKTTTCGKLAKYLVSNKNRKPLLVAADIYRPAAVAQLKVLGERIEIPVFHVDGMQPEQICRTAVQEAYRLSRDTIIFDTAGRLAVDDTLMNELVRIKLDTQVDHILFVCDAMMGQDAVVTAKAFDDRLSLTGIILTKLDGDARGGAALSIKEVTGKPIMFLGMGESLDRLEQFRPEGLASRILGMGDVVGLMADFEQVSTQVKEEDVVRMLEGRFTFRDFYQQISMIQKMGPIKDVLAKLPMQDMLPKGLAVNDHELSKIKSMIDSMTEKERVNPSLFSDSRIKRVARGSGRSSREVSELVQRFSAMRRVFGQLGGGGLLSKIPGLGGLNQVRQMTKQMKQGFAREALNLAGEATDSGPENSAGTLVRKSPDRDKLRRLRKAQRSARKTQRR